MFGFMQLPQPTTPFVPFTNLVTILSSHVSCPLKRTFFADLPGGIDNF